MPDTNRDLLLEPTTGDGTAVDNLPTTRLDSLLADAPAVAKELLAGDVSDQADATLVLRSVAATMGRAVRDHDPARFNAGISAFAKIWRLGNPKAMYPIRTPDFEASLWERIVIELYALGALALLHERYAEARELATHDPDPAGHRESWLRQGQVAGSRAATYDENVLRLAARRLSDFAPGIGGDGGLQALAQFDFVSALVISEKDKDGFYPNAAEFPADMVEDLVVDQLRDAASPLRQHVYSGDDQGLRDALGRYDTAARMQAALRRRHGGSWAWQGFADARTLLFIARGQKLEEWEIGQP